MASKVDIQVCSVAQRCLWIAELARQVVQHAAHDSMKDVVALSTTCRAIHDSAQDEIWRNLNDLRDLVKCFPEDVWEEPVVEDDDTFDVVCPKRPPRANEWERFLANAARVRSFIAHPSNGLPRTLQYWGLYLAFYRPVLDIFPNLQRLEWRDNYYEEAPVFGSIFIGSKLRTFVLAWLPDPDLYFELYRSPGDISSIICLAHKAPSLREFRLEQYDPDLVKESDLNNAILLLVSATQLQILESNVEFSLSDLTKLVQARTTKQLDVTLLASEPTLPDAERGHLPFALGSDGLQYWSHTHNTVNLPTDAHARRLMQHSPTEALSSALKTLTIRRATDEFTAERVKSIFSTIATNTVVSSSLRKFAYLPSDTHSSTVTHTYHQQDQWSMLKIDRDIYSPLLSMKALTHLQIASNYLDLNDQDIHDLVSNLHHLESLLLFPEFYHSDRIPSDVTIDSLWCVAHHSSNLRELGLAVNFAANYPRRAIERRNMTCRRLDFADSFLPQGRVDELAMFLHGLFRHPELSIDALHHDYCDDLQFLADNDVIAEKRIWQTCSKRLHSLASQTEPNEQD